MSIHADKCLELGLLKPLACDTHITYITRSIAAGYALNTRACRFIGIHNLHSIIPQMSSKGLEFTHFCQPVYCPFTGSTPPEPVAVIYMTPDQQANFRSNKKSRKG